MLEWRVKPGDHVERGQIVAEVDTAKSAIEIEVFTDGVVDSILVPPGEEVPVGKVLARLRPEPAILSDATAPLSDAASRQHEAKLVAGPLAEATPAAAAAGRRARPRHSGSRR